MDFFLEEYLRHGLSDIYEIDSDFKESEAGYGSHDYRKTVAARKGDLFVKVSAHEHAWFGFKGGRNLGITSDELITESQYQELIAGKERVDNPENVQAVKSHQESLRKRYEAEDKLNAIEHQCPKCKGKMHWKSGRFGPFWGCVDYPNCNGTLQMTADEKKFYKQYSGEDQPSPIHP